MTNQLMVTGKLIAAVAIGLVFGMLSVYALLNPELRVLETELERTTQQLNSQESQISNLVSEMDILSSEMKDLEIELDSRRLALLELQGFLAEATAKLQDEDDENQVLQSEIADLKIQISGKESEISNLNLRVSTLESEINRLGDMIVEENIGQPLQGTILVYGSIDAEDIQPVIDAFHAIYPSLTVEYTRGSPSEVVARITIERDAGLRSADLTLVSFPGTLQLISENVYRPYRSPEANSFLPEQKDPLGLWTSVIILGQVIVYNTDLVPESELPRTLDDLTDPKWKGQVTMHDYTRGTTSTQIWASMAERIGQDNVANFLTKLEANVQPIRQRSTGAQVDEVAVGEYYFGIVGQLHDVVSAKLAGAPVEILQLDDFPAMISPTTAAILSTAANPDGAEVFVDFLLSADGQMIFGNVEVRFPARPGINSRFSVGNSLPSGMETFRYPTQDVFDNLDIWIQRFRAIAGV